MLSLPDPELLAQAIEYLPDALVIVDRNSRIVLLNRQTEIIFGYPRAQLLGQPLEILMPERFRERHRGHLAGFAQDPHVRPMGVSLPLAALSKEGEEFSVAINLSPLVISTGMFFAAVIRRKDSDPAPMPTAARPETT